MLEAIREDANADGDIRQEEGNSKTDTQRKVGFFLI